MFVLPVPEIIGWFTRNSNISFHETVTPATLVDGIFACRLSSVLLDDCNMLRSPSLRLICMTFLGRNAHRCFPVVIKRVITAIHLVFSSLRMRLLTTSFNIYQLVAYKQCGFLYQKLVPGFDCELTCRLSRMRTRSRNVIIRHGCLSPKLSTSHFGLVDQPTITVIHSLYLRTFKVFQF